MTLVLALGIMAAVAALALAWPLWRRRGAAPSRAEYDRAVFADQLAELARDIERGLIGPTEAAAARAEIERRALTVLETDARGAAPGRHRAGRALAVVMIVVLPALSGLGYVVIGRPDLPALPYAARPKPPPVATGTPKMPGPEALAGLAQMVEARLAEAPDESQGWTLLIRLYRRLDRGADADAAFATALRTAPDAARRGAIALAYGEALTGVEKGIVTPAAKAAFDVALTSLPGDPAARYYWGLWLAQSGDVAGALALWRAIEKDGPADAPWREKLKSDIERLAREAPRPR